MEKNEPKPLNFERARLEIRKEVLEWLYKDIKQPDEYLVSLAIAHAVRKSFERVKSACEFYLEWWNNPKTFIIWYEDKRKVNELIKFMEHWFGEYWQDKFDSLEDKRIKIILKYNEWLFKLAFGLREDEKNG